MYAAGIIILGVLAYRGSLFGKFLLDDITLVVFNLHIRDLSGAARLFAENIGSGIGREVSSGFYRPLQMLSYALDYRLWNLSYIGYHFTNLILHILTALGVYWFVRLISKNRMLSFLSGVLFAVHPVHTEAVSYISGRADPLSVLFVLLSLIFYIKYLDFHEIRHYLLFPLCYFMALLSRESSLLLPFLILLYHYSFRRAIKLSGMVPLVIVTAAYIFMRSVALKSMLPHFASAAGPIDRLAGFFAAFADYIRLLFLPYGLHMEYGRKIFHFNDPKVLSGLLLFLLIAAYALRKRKQGGGLAFFSVAWFIIALLPVSNIFPMAAYMAEHWLYLPSVGFFILLSGALLHLYRIEKAKAAALILMTVLPVSYTIATIKQNNYWSDPVVFYTRTLEYSPGSARMYTYLALYYQMQKKDKEAALMFKKAHELEEKGNNH